VLAANSSWCREGPRINLGHGLARTNESRAWPGVAILIRRGGQRPWDLGRFRVERRAACWLPSGTCRVGGCVWREVQRVLGGACSGLQWQMRQVRRGDLELRTGDSERGPGRSFHQRVAPGPPCEADPSCTSAPSRPHPSEAAETACQRFARNRLSDSSSWTVTLALPTAGIVWSHHNPLGAPPGC
jgi:hypothetical protein